MWVESPAGVVPWDRDLWLWLDPWERRANAGANVPGSLGDTRLRNAKPSH